MITTAVLACLAFISLAISVWQWIVARRFPLHRRVTDTDFAPAVTVLKPLKGCDAETFHCLESWLTQDYRAAVQVLFGVGSPADPVCEIVRSLLAAHPRRDAQLIVCSESLGPNAKVSTLIQLQRHAKHEVLIVSDADVRVPSDFLTNVVAPLRDSSVGLVNCFYRLANPSTLAMQWEAIAINSDFWSQVLQSRSLKPIDFALGAVMATTRERLDAIGGFEALVDHLADDYQLGNKIARTGVRIDICPVVVECRESPKTWGDVWRHQLRWARTIRVCQPIPFFLSILGNATLWPLLLVLAGAPQHGMEWTRHLDLDSPVSISNVTVTQLNVSIAVPWTAILFLICLLVRIVAAASNRAQMERSRAGLVFFWFIPIKDILNAAIWACAILGNRVVWRGRRYRVTATGKLVNSVRD